MEEISKISADQNEELVETSIDEVFKEVLEIPLVEAPETSSKPSKAKKSEIGAASAHDDFDWSADDAGFETYSKDERKQLEVSYNSTFQPVIEKQVVKGVIVGMNEKDVVINIGFKSDGLVSRQEFRDIPNLALGDEVEVFVDVAEDKMGQLILSRKKALQETAWEKIVDAHNSGSIVTGYVRSRTKGGLVVDVFSFDTFLPGSQIDTKPVRDYDQYVGKNMDFKIVKVNEIFKNVVVSHKALIEDDIEAQKSVILSKLEKGQVVEGVVKNMTSFGVFVDLGGIDGLLHITDISWGRINHPEEVLKLDDRIQVVILDYDDAKKRISLGLKQLSAHPWDELTDDVKEGSTISGKVVSVADYGAFIEIKPGIEGLVHVSEMSWSSHLRNPSEYLNVGDEVQTQVLTLNKIEHKMSLGIKQLTQDPWIEIENNFAQGTKHSGVVKNLTTYGLFLELKEGIDGLVHVSDLSWNKKIKHPSEFTKKGAVLDVIVLEVDKINRRLSLGHKQLEENPWETFETIFTIGSVHEGTVMSTNDKGATIQMQYGVEAFGPSRHIKKADNKPLVDDETLEFEVVEFSKDAKRIIVSHTNIWKGAERANKEAENNEKDKVRRNESKVVKKMNQTSEKSTFGELDALTALREQFEKAEKSTKKEVAAKVNEPIAPDAGVVKSEKIIGKSKSKVPVKEVVDATTNDAKSLKSLSGVGPVMEKRMNGLGINSLQNVLDLDTSHIETMVSKDAKISSEQWNKWIEEAKSI
ncbi:MAG: 30S ribosomal protein S1 [Flavobacteriales bacterium]|nr:MAG: 30S ribosomal protein S1 [Flavobacteriales bacterium]